MNGSQRLGTIHISKNGVVIAFQNKDFNNAITNIKLQENVVIAFQNKAFDNLSPEFAYHELVVIAFQNKAFNNRVS